MFNIRSVRRGKQSEEFSVPLPVDFRRYSWKRDVAGQDLSGHSHNTSEGVPELAPSREAA